MNVYEPWTKAQKASFDQRPLVLKHRLHHSPLFALETLQGLIKTYPRSSYALVRLGEAGRRVWEEGDIGELEGFEVVEAIKAGRMWLNLRNIAAVDSRYQEVAESILAEIGQNLPGFSAYDLQIGVLISSPKVEVYYHADLPGQGLWQMHGRKRLYLYPAKAPYVRPEHLEGIAVYGVEVDMPYDPAYDRDARVIDLEPGQMAHWPLNAPHRIENFDCLNVSMTMEFWTDDIRRRHMLNVANGLLRHHLGLKGGRNLSGPTFWGKAALQAAARRGGWLKRLRGAKRPISFRLERQGTGTQDADAAQRAA